MKDCILSMAELIVTCNCYVTINGKGGCLWIMVAYSESNDRRAGAVSYRKCIEDGLTGVFGSVTACINIRIGTTTVYIGYCSCCMSKKKIEEDEGEIWQT